MKETAYNQTNPTKRIATVQTSTLRAPVPPVTSEVVEVVLCTGGVFDVEDGGCVIVLGTEVLPEDPLCDGEVHPSPRSVTVTAKLTVDNTVVVAHEVTVAFVPHSPSLVDEGPELVPVPLVVLGVEDSDVEEVGEVGAPDELGPPEDAVKDDVEDVDDPEDELVVGTPHSSKLWPSSQHHTFPPNSCHAQ